MYGKVIHLKVEMYGCSDISQGGGSVYGEVIHLKVEAYGVVINIKVEVQCMV